MRQIFFGALYDVANRDFFQGAGGLLVAFYLTKELVLWQIRT